MSLKSGAENLRDALIELASFLGVEESALGENRKSWTISLDDDVKVIVTSDLGYDENSVNLFSPLCATPENVSAYQKIMSFGLQAQLMGVPWFVCGVDRQGQDQLYLHKSHPVKDITGRDMMDTLSSVVSSVEFWRHKLVKGKLEASSFDALDMSELIKQRTSTDLDDSVSASHAIRA